MTQASRAARDDFFNSLLVVVMAALDHEQIETFARAKGVIGVQDFVHELEKSDLMIFARRPLDLGWLVEFWRDRGRLGPLCRRQARARRPDQGGRTGDRRNRHHANSVCPGWVRTPLVEKQVADVAARKKIGERDAAMELLADRKQAFFSATPLQLLEAVSHLL
jgi:hypothetical protein